MTTLDWILAGFVALTALGGYRRGLFRTAVSLAGLVAGALVGARVAPRLLHGAGYSHYTALVALGGAVVGAVVLWCAASFASSFARSGLRLLPPLRIADSLGGFAVGAVWGVVLVWVAGAVALQVPGYPSVRKQVHRSDVLTRLNRIAPPRDVLLIRSRIGNLSTLSPESSTRAGRARP